MYRWPTHCIRQISYINIIDLIFYTVCLCRGNGYGAEVLLDLFGTDTMVNGELPARGTVLPIGKGRVVKKGAVSQLDQISCVNLYIILYYTFRYQNISTTFNYYLLVYIQCLNLSSIYSSSYMFKMFMLTIRSYHRLDNICILSYCYICCIRSYSYTILFISNHTLYP